MNGRFARAVMLFALIAFAIPAHGQTSAALPPQTNRDGGITVKVTPLPATGGSWRFEVVLDTHSVALTQDLAADAVLIDDDGREHKPSAWDGDPPGGHHRKGTLNFESVPEIASLRLEIRQVGTPNRRFSWQVKK